MKRRSFYSITQQYRMAPQQASDGDRSWWEGSDHLLELIDKSVDFVSNDLLACDHGTKGVLQRSGGLLSCRAEEKDVIISRDYAKLHDDFLESLMQEQSRLPSKSTCLLHEPPPILIQSSSSSSYGVLPTMNGAASTESSPSQSMRRRPLKLSRRSPTIARKSPQRISRRQIVDVSTIEVLRSNDILEPIRSSNVSSITHLTETELAPPITFLHSSCRLQKDKGKGETPGSDICANGAIPSLEKVRQKIELLAQVAMDSKKKSTNMKRRKANITEETKNYTETRSIIELRMGFLYMQYGILLRWDILTGKVVLILLRKMCHESFYIKDLVTSRPSNVNRAPPTAFHVYNVVGGNEAILQRDDATEVTLLEAPYRVDRPSDFTPTLLAVTILKLEGLPVKYDYSVIITYGGISQKCRLESGDNSIVPKRNNELLEWHVSPGDIELELEVAIEQRRHRHKRKRVLLVVRIPVNILDKGRQHCLKLTESCTLTLSVTPQSEFVSWVRGELEARRQEEEVEVESPVLIRKVVVEAKEYESFFDHCCLW